MHKRREIALRRTRQTNESEDPNIRSASSDIGTFKAQPTSTTAKDEPSFFNKVSAQMSRAFSLDKTSTRVASAMAKQKTSKDGEDRRKIKESKSMHTRTGAG